MSFLAGVQAMGAGSAGRRDRARFDLERRAELKLLIMGGRHV
jgi:hypothetical protein